jgi:hypothetical protein
MSNVQLPSFTSLLGRAKPPTTASIPARPAPASPPKAVQRPAAKPHRNPVAPQAARPAPSSTRRPANVSSTLAFGGLVSAYQPDDDLADSPARDASAVLAKAKAQAAVFQATIEKLRHPIAPPPPPAGSQAARFLAAIAPKTTGPIQTANGVATPLKPGSAAWQFMQAGKKARGEI